LFERIACIHGNWWLPAVVLAMQKVEGSSPFIRS
jgi:hypothetical protein